jgi:hypothetical protein
LSDLPDQWFPDHQDGEIAPVAQAKRYPYPSPDVDFWMRDGLPDLHPSGISGDDLAGRTAVLSVGSNRAPLQLRRKFGPGVTLPVTRCRLRDCDIVFAATLSHYCASPATACPSPGTVVDLNIAWLDHDQLGEMHNTEAVGTAYDYIQLDDGIVDHGDRGEHPAFKAPVFGYQSKSRLLDLGDGPVAHSAISASRRVFTAMTEEQVLEAVKDRAGNAGGPDAGLDDWILSLRGSPKLRHAVADKMAGFAAACPDAPWTVLEAKAARPEAYL